MVSGTDHIGGVRVRIPCIPIYPILKRKYFHFCFDFNPPGVVQTSTHRVLSRNPEEPAPGPDRSLLDVKRHKGASASSEVAAWSFGVLFFGLKHFFSGWSRDLSCCSGFQDGSLVGIGRRQETQKPWKPCKL